MSSRRRNWLSTIIRPVTQYILTNLSVTIAYLFFKLLNRTVVVGKHHVPQRSNTLLLSNHQSMIDSFLVGMIAFYPISLIRPNLMPWNPAAEENFYANPVLSWFATNWKCIPIKKGRKDVGAIFRMAEALRQGPMTFFPEGTRTRDGSIGKARGGAGMLILETQPTVVPVCIDGMSEVLPIGNWYPRLFKRVYVYFGEPVDLCEYYGMEKSREVAQTIMEIIMDRIRIMHSEIQELRAQRNRAFLKASIHNKGINSQKA